MKERGAVPRERHCLWGRPARQIRTPVNMGNRPHRDNGEAVVGYANHRFTRCRPSLLVHFTPWPGSRERRISVRRSFFCKIGEVVCESETIRPDV